MHVTLATYTGNAARAAGCVCAPPLTQDDLGGRALLKACSLREGKAMQVRTAEAQAHQPCGLPESERLSLRSTHVTKPDAEAACGTFPYRFSPCDVNRGVSRRFLTRN